MSDREEEHREREEANPVETPLDADWISVHVSDEAVASTPWPDELWRLVWSDLIAQWSEKHSEPAVFYETRRSNAHHVTVACISSGPIRWPEVLLRYRTRYHP